MTKLLAFGDWSDNNLEMNENNMGKLTLDYINSHKDDVDAILFAGDLAYNLHDMNDDNKTDDLGANGDKWMKAIMNVTSSVPFMVIFFKNFFSLLLVIMKVTRKNLKIMSKDFTCRTKKKLETCTTRLISIISTFPR